MQVMHSDCNILKATSSEAYSLYDMVQAYDMNTMIRYQLMVLSRNFWRGDSPVFQWVFVIWKTDNCPTDSVFLGSVNPVITWIKNIKLYFSVFYECNLNM